MTETNWTDVMNHVADLVRRQFKKDRPFHNDGDVSPETIAIRDGLAELPVSTEIVLVDVGAEAAAAYTEKEPIWTLSRIDFAPEQKRVRFHGVETVPSLQRKVELMEEVFAMPATDLDDLNIRGRLADDLSVTTFLETYRIDKHPEKFARRLYNHLVRYHSAGLVERFVKRTDFSALYDLKPDPSLTEAELLQSDFGNTTLAGQPTLEWLYNKVSTIVLIPAVPESVRRVLQRAKWLHVYAYFKWEFYTVGNHYAVLAVDAALRARWTADLKQPVRIEHLGKKNPGTVEKTNYTYSNILSLCKEGKWDKRSLIVNGEPFPESNAGLLDWLIEREIINNFQRDRIEYCLERRNTLSHLEHAPIDWAGARELREAAELINILFHFPTKRTVRHD